MNEERKEKRQEIRESESDIIIRHMLGLMIFNTLQ